MLLGCCDRTALLTACPAIRCTSRRARSKWSPAKYPEPVPSPLRAVRLKPPSLERKNRRLPLAVGRGRGRRACDVKPCAGHLRGSAGFQRRFERGGTGGEIGVGRRRGEAGGLAVLERPRRGHVLAVHRGDAGNLDRLVGQALQRAAVGVVARCGAAPPFDPDRRRDVEVLGAPAGRDPVAGKARVRFDRAVQRDRGIFSAGGFHLREDDLAKTEGFFAGDHQLAVLRTVT